MERRLITHLQTWKNSPYRKPLLLYGARQVGKTYLIEEFGKRGFQHTAYLDLERNDNVRMIFEQSLDPKNIIAKLERHLQRSIEPDTTLVILDEVQASNRALASLKYFSEELPQLALIAAGSLLGIAVKESGFTAPVGKVDTLTLHPLGFDEFLVALGRDSLIDEIQECFESNTATPFHDELLDYFFEYLLVGGMPEVVLRYTKGEGIDECRRVQNTILDLYVADMVKYASSSETARIRDVWASVPAQLSKPNIKFQYKTVKSGGRAYHYQDALSWLETAGLIDRMCRVTTAQAPLALYAEPDAFRAFMLDIGLLTCRLGITPQMTASRVAGTNFTQGAVMENATMQALVANGCRPYYWESTGIAQVDFLLQDSDGAVIPIETKSSTRIHSSSLRVFFDKFSPPYAIKVSTKNFGFGNNIKSVPLYALWCLG